MTQPCNKESWLSLFSRRRKWTPPPGVWDLLRSRRPSETLDHRRAAWWCPSLCEFGWSVCGLNLAPDVWWNNKSAVKGRRPKGRRPKGRPSAACRSRVGKHRVVGSSPGCRRVRAFTSAQTDQRDPRGFFCGNASTSTQQRHDGLWKRTRKRCKV